MGKKDQIMRWLLALALVTLCLPVSAQENEGEKLYRKAEQLVKSAKGIKVLFEAAAEFGKDMPIKSQGMFAAADGNKGRIELKTTRDGKTSSTLMIADGMETGTIEDGKVAGQKRPVDPSTTAVALALLIRGGIGAVLDIGPDPKNKFEIDKILPISDFKLGAKEKVGNLESQVVTYKIAPPMREPLQVTLWLDTKSQLPIKRTAVVDLKDSKVTVVESYSEFTVNPTFDAKMFELPK
jgi:outer membrane lipoprotein-sorting protein